MPQCTSCHQQSPDGAKFCLECGAPFARACASCGHPVPDGAKFCMECGTPVAGAGPAAPRNPGGAAALGVAAGGPISERRTTTVLFGDLVSFTTLSEARDPEEVRELLSEYFAVARTVVGRYGGTIEKFIGDAVMAVWGVPVSHEDDAERAVRAGLDLVAEVAALGERVAVPGLAMRVGITTGSVAVTLGALNEGMVAGDAVNTAARVQTAASPSTVWVDTETRGLTAAAVAYSDMGEHAMKGKAEPARLFRADAIVAAVGGANRVDGLEAPMTGRDAELRRLKELFHATEGDGRARIVLVAGMAGVGKSRLGWEFEKYIDGLHSGMWWHRGRCLSYGEGVAFWAFAEMVRSRLGLLESDDRDQTATRLADGVTAYASSAEEAAWLRPRLAVLLGVGDGATFERTDLFAAWTTLLERVGADGDPVVLVFEDMQHADSGLLDLVEHLLETCRARLFVVAIARPELLEERPSLASGRRAAVLNLQPLPDEAMSALVDGLVSDLPDKARAAIVGRAEGVPLYAVETVRSLVDRDAVQARDGRYVFVDHHYARVDLDQLTAPTSLQRLIAARLDTLGAVERRTVQDAAVLGTSFRHAGLMALSEVSGYELDVALAALVRKDVVEQTSDPRSPELGQYRFVQALVREVAYSTLARKDRKTRHLAAAGHLEGQGADVAESLAGIVAQHLLDALDAMSAHDPERPVVTARARDRLTTAAARAELLGSPLEALRSVLAALDLAPDDLEAAQLQERGARVAVAGGELTRGLALASDSFGGYDALGLRGDAARVLAVQARALQNLGRVQESDDLAHLALDLLGPDGDTETRILLLVIVSFAARARGDGQRQQEVTLEVLRLAEVLQDAPLLNRSLNMLAIMLVDAGSPTAYRAVLERCISLAREERLLPELGRSLGNLSSEVYQSDLARARELIHEAVAVHRQTGDSYYTEVSLINASFIWWLGGDWDLIIDEVDEWFNGREVTSSEGTLRFVQALVSLARGLPVPEVRALDSGDPWEQVGTDLIRALATADAGDTDSAAASARSAVVQTYGRGDVFEDFEMMWVPALELQLQAGDVSAAREVLALADPVSGVRFYPLTVGEVSRMTAMVVAAEGGDPEPHFRAAEQAHSAYGAPFALARTRHELARWLLGQDRVDEAVVLLDLARETYTRLRATPALEDLDALSRSRTSA